jgi:hypothetical protein
VSSRLARGAAALALAALLSAAEFSGALAQQENLGSTVTIGGGVDHVDGGDAVHIAPGVIISGGTVANETGIGVIISGGSSVGASVGGDTNAAVDE